jgi:hypothetical protein
VAYDRADWHYGGDFPEGLPTKNGGTHIGMFIAWAIAHGLEGDLHREEGSATSVQALRERRMTGCDFLFQECDEKFWEEDLNELGNAFASWYYEDRGDGSLYIDDYCSVLGEDLESLYHVADTWENYDKLATVIDERFEEWRSSSHYRARESMPRGPK